MEILKVVGVFFFSGRFARGCESDCVADYARSSDHGCYVQSSGEERAERVGEARWGFCGAGGTEVFCLGGWGEGRGCLSGA